MKKFEYLHGFYFVQMFAVYLCLLKKNTCSFKYKQRRPDKHPIKKNNCKLLIHK